MRQYSTREFRKLLTDNGFVYDRCKGDHYIYTRGKELAVVNKNLNMMVAKRLIKEFSLSV